MSSVLSLSQIYPSVFAAEILWEGGSHSQVGPHASL